MNKTIIEQISNMIAIVGIVIVTTLSTSYVNESHTRAIVLEELAKRDLIHQQQHLGMIAAMTEFSAKTANVSVIRHESKLHKGAKQ